jgi:hypothetical protein
VIFVDHNDLSRLPLGEMKRNRCSHDARAEDYDVGGLWP